MGADTILLQGTALRHTDDRFAGALQADGTHQRRDHILYRMATPAMGAEAHVATVCRTEGHAPVVDSRQRDTHGSRTRRRGPHAASPILPAGIAGTILARSVLVRRTQLRCRRAIPPDTRATPYPRLLDTHRLLPSGHIRRTGHSGDDGRQPAGGIPWQHGLLLEPRALWRGRTVGAAVDIPRAVGAGREAAQHIPHNQQAEHRTDDWRGRRHPP